MTTQTATVFNPMQVHLLQMFAVNKSERGLDELRSVLYAYYSQRMTDHLNALWDTGKLDQARLDEINRTDLHQMMRQGNANRP